MVKASSRAQADADGRAVEGVGFRRLWLGTGDSLLLILLAGAIGIVHAIDTRLYSGAAGERAASASLHTTSEDMASQSSAARTEEGMSGNASDASVESGSTLVNGHPENEGPAPQQTLGIIADFVPFTPEFVTASEPPSRDVMQPALPAATDQIADIPTPDTPVEVPARKVEFFETETRANAVGFIVDCSSSMAGAKFEAVRSELARSILQLKSDQRFFVVFFNDSFFPMTGNSARPALVPADLRSKQQILAFLKSATSSGGTNPEPALRFMAGLRPDVVYLLTDGEFQQLQPDTYRQLAGARIAVHTIGFETGYTVPILQEIASRTQGTYRSATAGRSTPDLVFQSPAVIRGALTHADPAVRREAVVAAIIRELPFAHDLIGMLDDADDTIRQTVHYELRTLAEGTDFGPHDLDDAAGAITRWRRWYSLRRAARDQLLAGLSHDDPDERWIAASLIRINRLNVPDECIKAMTSAPSPVWQELRAAIRQSCPGQDFGPPDAATAEQVAEAADRWAAWRAEEREREEQERLAKRIKLAKEKLRLARDLIEDNPEAVVRRCRELIRNFADTPSAEEAKVLLEEVGGTLEGE
jgi:hypothetical protein